MFIFPVVKPPGMTSHDVVDFVRGLADEKRVGHAGTLDPAATGLLVILAGRATRLSPHIMAYQKTYRVEVTFGIATDTGDIEGEVIAEQPANHLRAEHVQTAAEGLRGVLVMQPHRYSAVKVKGRKAYELARSGEKVELPERTVVVHAVRMLDFQRGYHPRALLEITCGKGTYIRSLAELLGRELGTVAYASFMLRTRIGPLHVNDAWTLDELAELAREGRLAEASMSAEQALSGYRQVKVPSGQARLLSSGTAVPFAGGGRSGDVVAVHDEEGQLICMAEIRGERPQVLQPRTVLATVQS